MGEVSTPATVLIGDDDAVVGGIYRDYLVGHGYQVILAPDGPAAVAAAAEHKPNLILMDLKMPGMDGLEATRRIKSNASTRPVPVVLYSSAFPAFRALAMEAGADEFIDRPHSPTELLALVQRIIGP
jgi:two-component system response regulator ResD